ncbi:MAG TPA: hypothetical protein VND64_16200 [Pirellulales bacterium]|nr:hypothetical protein [Pirellulales bacterium]
MAKPAEKSKRSSENANGGPRTEADGVVEDSVEAGHVEARHASRFRASIVLCLTGGLVVVFALVRDLLPGSAPGLGPLQIILVVLGGGALVAGAWLFARLPRDARRPLLRLAAVKTARLAGKLLLLAGMLSAAVGALEGWARWRAGIPRDERLWLKLAEDLPEKDQFLKDRGPWGRYELRYADYFLYHSAPRASPTVNFTSPFGARLCPGSVPAEEANQRIWFFGGSTMQNTETTDERTIANQATVRLNEAGLRVFSQNFGMGMFQSTLESIKFQELLRRVRPDERPTAVVFYDGFNDGYWGYTCGAGRMQADIASKLKLLVERDYAGVARYSLARGLFDWSQFYRDFGTWIFEPTGGDAGFIFDGSEENLRRTVEAYVMNTEVLRAICENLDIRPLFVLQPLVATKRGRTNDEEDVYRSLERGAATFVESFYRETRTKMADRDDFVDLSALLDDNGRTDFYDLGHTGPYTGAGIGHAIGERILTVLGPDERRSLDTPPSSRLP